MQNSVQYYKRLILALIILIIAALACTALYFGIRTNKLSAELRAAGETISSLRESKGESTEDEGEKEIIIGEGAAYKKLYPNFYAPKHRPSVEVDENTVYLSFDGPLNSETDKILNTLSRTGVKATFFVDGSDTSDLAVRRIRRILEDGHMIGILGASADPEKIYGSVEDYLADANEVFSWLKDSTNYDVRLVRLPGGSLNEYNKDISKELVAELERRNFMVTDWNATALPGGDANETAELISKQTEGLSRVFLRWATNEDSGLKADYLKQSIESLDNMGYNFEIIIPELWPVLFTYA